MQGKEPSKKTARKLTRKEKAGVIVAILFISFIGGVLVYSDNWPPIYVVESESMEHSQNWTIGTINTGDVVLAKNINGKSSNVVTYVQGRMTNYSTYGEYGNVILYDSPSGSVIIHRAMFYLSWNGSKPQVAGYNGQSWLTVTSKAVVIDNVGFTHRNLIVNLGNLVGENGFVTVGDYNLANSYLYNYTYKAYVAADQNVFGFPPAAPSKVVGTAFGQIPWVGLIKLNIMKLGGGWPQSNEVPNHAYIGLASLIIAIMVAAFFPYGRFGRRAKGKRKQ